MLGLLMFTLMHTAELEFPVICRAPEKDWHDFLGYKIASRVGMSACAVTTSAGIANAARLGCDILTYKTIRCYAWPAHPEPNIVHVDQSSSLTHDDIGKTVIALTPSSVSFDGDPNSTPFSFHSNGDPDWNKVEIGVANSFGIQSMDPESTKNDIQKAKQSLREGQVLIVSIFGNTLEEWAKTAQLAVEGGADIIEANFSCPNLHTNNEPVYTRPEDIFLITQTLVQTVPSQIPVILKFGVCADHELLRQALIAAAQAGAQGVCGINSVPMKVINADGAPTFGTRIFAGVSGTPIRQLALDFIKTASTIIHKDYHLFCSMIFWFFTMPFHFSQFLAAVATVALSATGMMHNPYLIAQYHEQQVKRVNKQELANKLFDIGVIKFGDFTFKSGIRSNNYVDMRLAMSYPDILRDLALCLNDIQQQCHADVLCPVPYAAVPVTTMLSMVSGIPMVMARKEAKDHGTKKMIEGVYSSGQECLLVEDVITTGASILETVKVIEDAGLKVKDVVGIIDRQQGGKENITNAGYQFHALFTLQELLSLLKQSDRISQETYDMVCASCEQTKKIIPQEIVQKDHALTYQERAAYCANPIAKRLLNIIETKKSNLAFSVDVVDKKEFLRLADQIGPEICILKTHCDIIKDFDQEFYLKMRALAQKHNFLIFEDRKFADIGSTTKVQYAGGVLRIAEWADIVTVHAVGGDGTIQGLTSTPETKDAACLLLAQMSSANTLAKGEYTQETVKMALQYKDNVIGFICLGELSKDPGILHFTTGVNLDTRGDKLGQQYLTPEEAIKSGSDIIIVGRGILHSQDPLAEAQRYKKAGWDAYVQRTHVAKL